MKLPGRQKFAQRPSTHECQRCGDSYPSETSDDLLLVRLHRLLHLAGDWKASFQPATYWITDEDGPRPVLNQALARSEYMEPSGLSPPECGPWPANYGWYVIVRTGEREPAPSRLE